MITILILQLDGTLLKQKHNIRIEPVKTTSELVIACSNQAEKIRNNISTHHWEYTKGDAQSHGWYLNDGSGRMVVGYMY